MMNMQEIRSLAKNFGIKTLRLSKIKLVRNIQQAEGNFDCFSTAVDAVCNRGDCLWRTDCFDAAVKTRKL
jgi:hypothetical protein